MKRAAFGCQMADIAPERLVFLDECGMALNLFRLYGWVMGGGRCVEEVPLTRGTHLSLLGAFSLPNSGCPNSGCPNSGCPSSGCPNGLRVLWHKSGAWNRASFEAFLQDGLLPLLPPGSVLVLDNARFHHGPSITALVEAAGCSLLYLPPYSPDLNPIELVWSWIKNLVRTLAPRDDEQRLQSIALAHSLLPPTAAANWFKHCGILLPD